MDQMAPQIPTNPLHAPTTPETAAFQGGWGEHACQWWEGCLTGYLGPL